MTISLRISKVFLNLESINFFAGQSLAAATTSHSTSVTQTLKDMFQKTGCLITKSQ